MGKWALFWGKAALFGVVQPKNLGHYFRVALFGMSLFGVLLQYKKLVIDWMLKRLTFFSFNLKVSYSELLYNSGSTRSSSSFDSEKS